MRTPVAVGHLDADCFYVSAERVRDPFLVGKAVGVLGNQGACVIAKSYEMRAAGVKTGEPIWEALERCPQGIYVKRDFRWYEVLSRKMLALVGEMSHLVEFYSIDEFFFAATPLRGRTFQETAEVIRDRIWNAFRVPVTVGIARTRTLAKLISDAAKPFGALAVLDKATEHRAHGRAAAGHRDHRDRRPEGQAAPGPGASRPACTWPTGRPPARSARSSPPRARRSGGS